MNVNQSVPQQIIGLCQEQNISINELCTADGLDPALTRILVDGTDEEILLEGLNVLCGNLNISIADFFQSDLSRRPNSK